MDQGRAAAALLALAACIVCSSAAPTTSNQTALDLYENAPEGCYYNFQRYGEGDRIMTNEPCLNCTCHNRMLMCYLKVCPFTKPIGQDCSVEKRADQCCPIVTCPDVPVDLLTSTSTSSPAEYGATGLGKLDKYGCSISGKYFPEGSKVPPAPNKPCEHCYCIRNMTTCVMQECTLHVDGCTPIYHKDVCCPIRYSCDHPEDEIPLLDDMTTTVRPTPGFLLTTTTMMPVTQITQDCVHDDQIFPDGALIKTEKACEHCYCMKGDIVCVVQECGSPMENEGKNCTSLPPRHGQCCPDTYICEGDEIQSESITTSLYEDMTTSAPPRRVSEGSGYRNEPGEPYTETSVFDSENEGSGQGIPLTTTNAETSTIVNIMPETSSDINEFYTEKDTKPITMSIDEIEKDNDTTDNISPGFTISDIFRDTVTPATHDTTLRLNEQTLSEDTTEEVALTGETIMVDKTTTPKEQSVTDSTLDSHSQLDEEFIFATKLPSHDILPETVVTLSEDQTTDKILETEEPSEIDKTSHTESTKLLFSEATTISTEKLSIDTTTINPNENEIIEDESLLQSPGRIPGEGDCLLNGITYTNNSVVPTTSKCHSSCKCVSSIIKCDPIVCTPPLEYMENMNDCEPIYDSSDSCCPTYVCNTKETTAPESHSQMSETETSKPTFECKGDECQIIQNQQPNKTTENIGEDNKCGENGCTHDNSQKCVDGKCDIDVVQPPISEPQDNSEKCIDGKCDVPEEQQPISEPQDNSEKCSDGKCDTAEGQQPISEPQDNLDKCVDGKCENAEVQEPVLEPQDNSQKCPDGKCDTAEVQHPVSKPQDNSEKCIDGKCDTAEIQQPISEPQDNSEKCVDGKCDTAEIQQPISEPQDNSEKCVDGKCDTADIQQPISEPQDNSEKCVDGKCDTAEIQQPISEPQDNLDKCVDGKCENAEVQEPVLEPQDNSQKCPDGKCDTAEVQHPVSESQDNSEKCIDGKCDTAEIQQPISEPQDNSEKCVDGKCDNAEIQQPISEPQDNSEKCVDGKCDTADIQQPISEPQDNSEKCVDGKCDTAEIQQPIFEPQDNSEKCVDGKCDTAEGQQQISEPQVNLDKCIDGKCDTAEIQQPIFEPQDNSEKCVDGKCDTAEGQQPISEPQDNLDNCIDGKCDTAEGQPPISQPQDNSDNCIEGKCGNVEVQEPVLEPQDNSEKCVDGKCDTVEVQQPISEPHDNSDKCIDGKCNAAEVPIPISDLQDNSKKCVDGKCDNAEVQEPVLEPQDNSEKCVDGKCDNAEVQEPVLEPQDNSDKCVDGKCDNAELQKPINEPCNLETGCQVPVIRPCENDNCDNNTSEVTIETTEKGQNTICENEHNCENVKKEEGEICHDDNCRRKEQGELESGTPCSGKDCPKEDDMSPENNKGLSTMTSIEQTTENIISSESSTRLEPTIQTEISTDQHLPDTKVQDEEISSSVSDGEKSTEGLATQQYDLTTETLYSTAHGFEQVSDKHELSTDETPSSHTTTSKTSDVEDKFTTIEMLDSSNKVTPDSDITEKSILSTQDAEIFTSSIQTHETDSSNNVTPDSYTTEKSELSTEDADIFTSPVQTHETMPPKVFTEKDQLELVTKPALGVSESIEIEETQTQNINPPEEIEEPNPQYIDTESERETVKPNIYDVPTTNIPYNENDYITETSRMATITDKDILTDNKESFDVKKTTEPSELPITNNVPTEQDTITTPNTLFDSQSAQTERDLTSKTPLLYENELKPTEISGMIEIDKISEKTTTAVDTFEEFTTPVAVEINQGASATYHPTETYNELDESDTLTTSVSHKTSTNQPKLQTETIEQQTMSIFTQDNKEIVTPGITLMDIVTDSITDEKIDKSDHTESSQTTTKDNKLLTEAIDATTKTFEESEKTTAENISLDVDNQTEKPNTIPDNEDFKESGLSTTLLPNSPETNVGDKNIEPTSERILTTESHISEKDITESENTIVMDETTKTMLHGIYTDDKESQTAAPNKQDVEIDTKTTSILDDVTQMPDSYDAERQTTSSHENYPIEPVAKTTTDKSQETSQFTVEIESNQPLEPLETNVTSSPETLTEKPIIPTRSQEHDIDVTTDKDLLDETITPKVVSDSNDDSDNKLTTPIATSVTETPTRLPGIVYDVTTQASQMGSETTSSLGESQTNKIPDVEDQTTNNQNTSPISDTEIKPEDNISETSTHNVLNITPEEENIASSGGLKDFETERPMSLVTNKADLATEIFDSDQILTTLSHEIESSSSKPFRPTMISEYVTTEKSHHEIDTAQNTVQFESSKTPTEFTNVPVTKDYEATTISDQLHSTESQTIKIEDGDEQKLTTILTQTVELEKSTTEAPQFISEGNVAVVTESLSIEDKYSTEKPLSESTSKDIPDESRPTKLPSEPYSTETGFTFDDVLGGSTAKAPQQSDQEIDTEAVITLDDTLSVSTDRMPQITQQDEIPLEVNSITEYPQSHTPLEEEELNTALSPSKELMPTEDTKTTLVDHEITDKPITSAESSTVVEDLLEKTSTQAPLYKPQLDQETTEISPKEQTTTKSESQGTLSSVIPDKISTEQYDNLQTVQQFTSKDKYLTYPTVIDQTTEVYESTPEKTLSETQTESIEIQYPQTELPQEFETKLPYDKSDTQANKETESLSTLKDTLLSSTESGNTITESKYQTSETTPYFVELEEHTHVIPDITIISGSEMSTVEPTEIHTTVRGDQLYEDEKQEDLETLEPHKITSLKPDDNISYTPAIIVSEQSTVPSPIVTQKETSTEDEKYETISVNLESSTSPQPQIVQNEEGIISVPIETEKPLDSDTISDEKYNKPQKEESLETKTPHVDKTTVKTESTVILQEETTVATISSSIPEEKPAETTTPSFAPVTSKPVNNEVPTEELVPDFPPSGVSGYGQEPDYVEEDQAFGPGTCRYGGKVYVSAQQIPRDDPCDFCFCFRSDIICLQQSCPPPIHGCHEEPIQGFCCPRYECPVSMATTLNVTTTTTTTTTTLPPHFLPHAYKGAAQKKGCQIKGHSYKVGEVVRSTSGPCLHCTCGGDGQMKCDPKVCTPEPMLRQMIAAAVSARRRR